MQKEHNEARKIVKGLCSYIIELEAARSPVTVGVIPYSFKTFFELLAMQKQKSHFIKTRPDLYKKTRKILDNYFKGVTSADSSNFLPFLPLVLLIFSLPVISAIITVKYSLNSIQGPLFLVIISLPFIYLWLTWFTTRKRRINALKYDEDIKRALQYLVDNGAKLVKEENLNPKYYPIKLKHDDYEGLIYEKKGENDYIGYFKN